MIPKFGSFESIFEDIQTRREFHSFRFIESENQSSLLINQALIRELNGTIVFDFFPLVFGGGRLEENANSDLMIKCTNMFNMLPFAIYESINLNGASEQTFIVLFDVVAAALLLLSIYKLLYNFFAKR